MSVIERATQRLGIVLFLFGVLLILGQATGLAPFIYTLF